MLPPGTISIHCAFVEPLSPAEAFVTVILVLMGEAYAVLERRGGGELNNASSCPRGTWCR